MNEEFEQRIAAVVSSRLGREVTRIEPLAAGLGRRRFARVRLGVDGREPSTLIARIEAPEDPERRPAGVASEPPLEPIRALLEREGLPVPRRYAADEPGGIELLEDLGTQSLADAVATAKPENVESLYREACALVPRIQRIRRQPGVAAFDRQLDADQIRYKAGRFARWSFDVDPEQSRGAAATIRSAFSRIAEALAAAPQRLAHRDFQSANLLVIDADATRRDRIVMIDLQGAFMAPPEYDLMCLLRDSYVELADEQVYGWALRTREQLPSPPDAEEFRHRFDLMTLSRKAKDHGLYRYAAEQLGDSRYLRFRPTALRQLKSASRGVAQRDARFRDLDALIQSLAPDEQRDPRHEPAGASRCER